MEKNKIDKKINFLDCGSKYDGLLETIKNGVKGNLEIDVNRYRITVKCDDGRDVLRLKSNFVKVLVIEHLELDNKRKGIDTKILKWLEEYGIKNDFKVLTVESVLPDEIEMLNFCEKNNLKKNSIYGYNYSKELRH